MLKMISLILYFNFFSLQGSSGDESDGGPSCSDLDTRAMDLLPLSPDTEIYTNKIIEKTVSIKIYEFCKRNGIFNFFLKLTKQILLEEMSRFLHDQTLNLDVQKNAVFAKSNISKGTKYGPFIAKFTDKPLDRRYAWEVS